VLKLNCLLEPDTEPKLRIAPAACLFRIKNRKMELVSVTSKYFSTTTDLGKLLIRLLSNYQRLEEIFIKKPWLLKNFL
jgi:hypothetical protein